MVIPPADIQLTEEQDAIINAPAGHYVIRAVAGSGKTTTLAHRIVHLLEKGADARRLLVLMFNKSAQVDFQNKLRKIIAPNSIVPEVRTFHAMGFRLYKRFIQIGALPEFSGSVMSEREMQFHLLQILNNTLTPEQLSDFKRYKKEYLDVTARFIDQCKGQLDDPASFFRQNQLDAKFSFLPLIFERFEEWRKQRRRITYADMLYDPVQAILRDTSLKSVVENKMDTILVDEYQDTNDIQHTLLAMIAGERAKVTIVGDPDQTIYEFRGAKPQYMLAGFAEDYPDTRTMNLSKSFRYGHEVALIANQLIAHSDYHDQTLCIPDESNPSTKVNAVASNEELKPIIETLKRDSQQQTAILVRFWSQTAKIELALLNANLPYSLLGHSGIFGSNEMFALRTILELSAGFVSQLSSEEREARLQVLARFPHLGINERITHELIHRLAKQSSRWGNHLIGMIPDKLSRFQKLKLERFARALSAIENNPRKPKAIFKQFEQEVNLFDELKTSGLSRDSSEEQVRTIRDLIDYMTELPSSNARDLLACLAELEARAQQIGSSDLIITTIHRAKGLEWDRVILPGLSESTYFGHPSRKELTKQDVAGERRLLYVAITRARHSLTLLHPPAGNQDTLRFVHELSLPDSLRIAQAIHQKYQEVTVADSTNKTSLRYAKKWQLKLNNEEKVRPIKQGIPTWTKQEVHHAHLGRGLVVEEESDTFTVEFEDQQRRVFSKRFAEQVFEA